MNYMEKNGTKFYLDSGSLLCSLSEAYEISVDSSGNKCVSVSLEYVDGP